MVTAENVVKKFPGQEKRALDNLSFTAEKGQITALLGENGAGKTTILRIISAILSPDSGTCYVGGYDVTKNPSSARKLTGLLLGGETGLYERLTAEENIRYFAGLHSIPDREISGMIGRLSETLEMKDFIHKKCSSLSRGMKQKTAIARALIHNPQIVLLDEPAAGLDVTSSGIIHSFILKSKEEARTVLFSSHNITEIKKLADQVVIIHDGKISETGTPDELEKKYNSDLETLFIRIINTGKQENRQRDEF